MEHSPLRSPSPRSKACTTPSPGARQHTGVSLGSASKASWSTMAPSASNKRVGAETSRRAVGHVAFGALVVVKRRKGRCGRRRRRVGGRRGRWQRRLRWRRWQGRRNVALFNERARRRAPRRACDVEKAEAKVGKERDDGAAVLRGHAYAHRPTARCTRSYRVEGTAFAGAAVRRNPARVTCWCR